MTKEEAGTQLREIYISMLKQEILAKASMQVCMTQAKKDLLMEGGYNQFLRNL